MMLNISQFHFIIVVQKIDPSVNKMTTFTKS